MKCEIYPAHPPFMLLPLPFPSQRRGARGMDSDHGGVAAVVIQTGQGVASVLALALVLRVLLPVLAWVYTGDPETFMISDTPTYLKPAESLLRTGRFRYGVVGRHTRPDEPEIVRTPGYPVFLLPGLAAGHVLPGTIALPVFRISDQALDPLLAGHVLPVTITLQVLASCLTVYLVYRITLLLFKRRRLAVSCALLYAFEPQSILNAGLLASETLFTTMMTLFLSLPGEVPPDRLDMGAAGGGDCPGRLDLRPAHPWLLPTPDPRLRAGRLGTHGPRRFRPGRLLAHVALFLIVSMGLTGLWQLRNSREAGYPGFSAISDLNMYYYLGASVLAAREGVPFDDMQTRMGFYKEERRHGGKQGAGVEDDLALAAREGHGGKVAAGIDDDLYIQLHPEQRDWTRAEKYRYIGREGRRIVLEHPVACTPGSTWTGSSGHPARSHGDRLQGVFPPLSAQWRAARRAGDQGAGEDRAEPGSRAPAGVLEQPGAGARCWDLPAVQCGRIIFQAVRHRPGRPHRGAGRRRVLLAHRRRPQP